MRNFLLLIIIFLTGCASHYQINRHHNTFLRRMPQINKIESGRVIEEGSFSATASLSYALKEPLVMQVSDSSFESHSSMFGDEFTIITSSTGYCYESRLIVSGEALYGISDVFSVGLSLDASLGKLTGTPPVSNLSIFNNTIEGSVSLKFAKKFGHIGISIKPEMIISHLYGEKMWIETDTDSLQSTATEKTSHYALSVRSSSIVRYEILPQLTPFLGFQIKSQPYPLVDDIDHEICYGVYGGLDLVFNPLAITPFIAVPIGSSASHYKSPISAGTQVSLILKSNSH